mmetsp:Transcript_17831/g.47066  ORF Transcript_17831/g.47066 Transcript_17831/m.47066 type:complete len:400 (+) Transcript_17831:95-1294(+)
MADIVIPVVVRKLYPDGKLFWVDGVPCVKDGDKVEPEEVAVAKLADSLGCSGPVQWMCLLNEPRTRNGKYSIPHYNMKGYQDDGPPAIDQIAETCKLIDEVLAAGGSLAVFCPAGKEYESHRHFSALCVAAHAVLVRSMSASEVAGLFPDTGFWLNSWVRASGAQGPQRGLTLNMCLKAIALAKERKWFDYATFDSQAYRERWHKFDVAWYVPGEVLLLADPLSTVADPNPSTAKYLSMDGAPDGADPKLAFSTLLQDDNVKLMVRLNMENEMAPLKNYKPQIFEKEGIGHLDTSFPDLNGGVPSNEIIRKIFASCEQVPEGSAVAFHCKAGFGRSAVCAALWLIHRHNLPGDLIFAWLRMTRPGSITTPKQAVYLMKLKGREDIQTMLKEGPACCAIS